MSRNKTIARWLSRDPLGELGGINLYGYVGNNSVNLTDPMGLCPDFAKDLSALEKALLDQKLWRDSLARAQAALDKAIEEGDMNKIINAQEMVDEREGALEAANLAVDAAAEAGLADAIAAAASRAGAIAAVAVGGYGIGSALDGVPAGGGSTVGSTISDIVANPGSTTVNGP